jgi:hypothetical protein
MPEPTITPDLSPPLGTDQTTFLPPNDVALFDEGFDANNIIIQGTNNKITNSRRCTVINGSSNTISNSHNTHVVGDVGDVYVEHSFYVGCINGIHSEGDVVAFYASDERLKDDIVPISGCLEKINKIDAVEFNWNQNQQTYSGHDIGLIAQQIQEIAPEIVTERKNGYLAVKYEKMVPILVGAIKDQQKIINEMRAEIDELKLRINR